MAIIGNICLDASIIHLLSYNNNFMAIMGNIVSRKSYSIIHNTCPSGGKSVSQSIMLREKCDFQDRRFIFLKRFPIPMSIQCVFILSVSLSVMLQNINTKNIKKNKKGFVIFFSNIFLILTLMNFTLSKIFLFFATYG